MNRIEGQTDIKQLLRDPSLEQAFVGRIDATTAEETREVLQQRSITTDCLIVGTGPAGVSFAAELSRLDPQISIHMVDERPYRGGQFADPGYNYKLNTPKQGRLGFAGELGDPSNLGEGVLVQIADIDPEDEDYYRRKTLATCLKVDGFAVAPAIVATEIVSVEKVDDSYKIVGVHEGEEVMFDAKAVVFARGKGKPISTLDMKEATTGESVLVSEAFNTHVDTLSPQEVLALVTHGLALIGAGDSANTSLEAIINKLLTILSPDQVKQLSLDVYGARYTDALSFKEDVRIPRYDALIPFIGNFIKPKKEKAMKLLTSGYRTCVVTPQGGRMYNTVALMTGYANPKIENIVSAPVIDVYGSNGMTDEKIAQKVRGENIYVIGMDMQEEFPTRPPVFTRSIPRYTPLILATAQKVARVLR